MRADQIDLIHPGGTIELVRCQVPEFLEELDVGTFRAPFGTTWHELGTGHQLPGQVRIRGVLAATDFEDVDDLLEDLMDALPLVTQVRLGNWRIPVLGATGQVTATPTLTSYNVAFALVIEEGEWQQADSLSVDSLAYTVDSTSLTADQVGAL